ncbi:MAG: T9SS type A sorting domain-containing protein, partial [Bacteroidia bacterium]|nr:T9SS type A sorting domain-containing protein [Bacteroidia bacterium]
YTGKKILQKENVTQLQLDDFHPGIYFINVQQNNQSWNTKIIKQ